jgi:putative transposase
VIHQVHQDPGQLPDRRGGALKLFYLDIKNAGVHWRRPVEWTAAMGQLPSTSEARFPGSAR